MGRKRTPLQPRREGDSHVVYFRHPLKKSTVRISLGNGPLLGPNLDWLNKVFLNEKLWADPPLDMPPALRKAWLGGSIGVKLTPGLVKMPGEPPVLAPSDDPDKRKLKAQLALALAETQALRERVRELETLVRHREKEAEHWKGRKLRLGPSPTLLAAQESFLEYYSPGRPSPQVVHVRSFTKRFVSDFGPATPVEELVGAESKISAWLRGLPVKASTRHQYRVYVLRMLDHAGIQMKRHRSQEGMRVEGVTLSEIRRDRGPIRWLDKKHAEAVAKALPDYFADAFRLQVGTGLRPHELLLVRRETLAADFSILTLEPWRHLTLKNDKASNPIRVPQTVRQLIVRKIGRRGGAEDFVFPNPATGNPWNDPAEFDTQFKAALEAVGGKLKIPFPMDSRVGRRTCGSILLRKGYSVEQVAALLRNTPQMVREHYAAILPSEVDPTPAALK